MYQTENVSVKKHQHKNGTPRIQGFTEEGLLKMKSCLRISYIDSIDIFSITILR